MKYGLTREMQLLFSRVCHHVQAVKHLRCSAAADDERRRRLGDVLYVYYPVIITDE